MTAPSSTTKRREASCGCSVHSLSAPAPCALRLARGSRGRGTYEKMEHPRIRNLRPQREEKLRPLDSPRQLRESIPAVHRQTFRAAKQNRVRPLPILPQRQTDPMTVPAEGRSYCGAALPLFPHCPPRRRPTLPPQALRRGDTPPLTRARPAGPCAERTRSRARSPGAPQIGPVEKGAG